MFADNSFWNSLQKCCAPTIFSLRLAVGKWAVLFCPLFHTPPGIFRAPSAVPQEIPKQVFMNAEAIRLAG